MLARLFDKLSGGPVIPALKDRMASRASDFQLISVLPYVTPEGLDMKRPYVYPVHLRPMDEVGPVDRAVWRTAKISCADDICMEAATMGADIEIRAAGLDLTTRAAMMEAARRPEAEACRYIVFEHPLQKFKKGGLNSIVLENTAAPESNKAMVVTMVA
jgi:hypothetical protein